MFRPTVRRSPFADFIDWTDYRFDGPTRPRMPHQWGHRRRHPILRLLVLCAVIWIVARLLRGRRYSSWF